MTIPNDAAIYELRATLRDGSVTTTGLYATRAEAAEQTRLMLATGDACRVETVRRRGDRADVLSVIDEGRRPVADPRDDRLRPRHDDGGLIW